MSLIRHLSQIPTINGTFYHFNVRKPQNVLLQNAHCMGSLANRYQSILAGLSEPCQDSLCGMPEPHQNSWGLTSSSGVWWYVTASSERTWSIRPSSESPEVYQSIIRISWHSQSHMGIHIDCCIILFL